MGKTKAKSPDFSVMPMSKSRQVKQPQSTIVLEYSLLHDGKNESPTDINLGRTGTELFDFYEANIP
ncbi:hypothetical protein ANSO36C_27720 [Nostoc cf. commune SO-36]|uniref:Uncharacterized protein n=1 Tax=Nostoc cf. commune SO-36 TaxID=449208 RepID=A0ABM7Z1W7_NOSCO|nr:hypothetical protein ANSO36C_27720 [Nostoc cf. commune SO-36]